APPSADLAVPRIRAASPGGHGLGEYDAAEHASPGRGAVARVRDDNGRAAALDGATVAVGVQPVLESATETSGTHGFARGVAVVRCVVAHPLSLSRTLRAERM